MPNPVVKAVIITITALFLLIGGLFYLRQSGLSRNHKPLTADFIKKGMTIYHGGKFDLHATHSLQALELTQNLGFINMVSVQRTSDGYYVLFPDDILDDLTEAKGPVFLKSLEEIKGLKIKDNQGKYTGEFLTLGEYILKFGDKPFVLNIADQDPAMSMGIIDIIKKHNLLERIIVHSPYRNNIKTVRKYLPRAIFSVNTQAIMQARVFSSFFIETVAPIDGDIVIAPLKMFKSTEVLTPRLVEELNRRNLPIILKANSPLTSQQIQKYNPIATILTPQKK